MIDQRFFRFAGPLAIVLLIGAFACNTLAGWRGIAVLVLLILATSLAGLAGIKGSKWWLLLSGCLMILLIILIKAVAI